MDEGPEEGARPRDRAATSRGIVLAAKAILAEEGFAGFGINAVARRAGCDKQLIYRYHGGLDGLIDALAEELTGWVEARLPRHAGALLLTYGDLVEHMALALFDALIEDSLMRRIIAWEIAAPDRRIRVISDARSKAIAAWLSAVGGKLAPPRGVDAAAINALLIAGIEAIALTLDAPERSGRLDLADRRDIERGRTAIRRLVRGVYP